MSAGTERSPEAQTFSLAVLRVTSFLEGRGDGLTKICRFFVRKVPTRGMTRRGRGAAMVVYLHGNLGLTGDDTGGPMIASHSLKLSSS